MKLSQKLPVVGYQAQILLAGETEDEIGTQTGYRRDHMELIVTKHEEI